MEAQAAGHAGSGTELSTCEAQNPVTAREKDDDDQLAGTRDGRGVLPTRAKVSGGLPYLREVCNLEHQKHFNFFLIHHLPVFHSLMHSLLPSPSFSLAH